MVNIIHHGPPTKFFTAEHKKSKRMRRNQGDDFRACGWKDGVIIDGGWRRAWPAVLTLRATFLDKLFRTVPKLQNEMAELTSVEFLKAMIYERATIVLVAKFVYEVLEEFCAVPLYRPWSNFSPLSVVWGLPWGMGKLMGSATGAWMAVRGPGAMVMWVQPEWSSGLETIKNDKTHKGKWEEKAQSKRSSTA
ncbi:hypothetical protein DFH09DRAFT_1100690 [Mycena vulgaris]|nr:hypothetical protein DFH09DRAFT_1100690 [Mycena vulgaris]